MKSDERFFFDQHPDAFPIYEELAERVEREIPDVSVKVQKSQISLYNKHLFACVSFTRIRSSKDCPPCYITVTFGLGHRLSSDRVEASTEPYPGRWTHHLMLSRPEEVDRELMGWLAEAAEFSATKQRRKRMNTI